MEKRNTEEEKVYNPCDDTLNLDETLGIHFPDEEAARKESAAMNIGVLKDSFNDESTFVISTMGADEQCYMDMNDNLND